MDCEGSEFDIVPISDLTIFEEVCIEQNKKMAGKDHKIIINELINQGFEIKNKISWDISSFDEIGIIHAVNKNL